MDEFKTNRNGESVLLKLSVLVLVLIVAIFLVAFCIHEYTDLVKVDWN